INRSSLKVKREGAGVNRGCFVGERSVSEKTSKSTKGNGKNWKYYKQLVKIAALKNGGEIFKSIRDDRKCGDNWKDLQIST
ncbi:hypothetical protein L917_10833, partial [Phytophthora nicotianae]